MARILGLGKSGFGKSTGIGKIPELGLTGLDPKTTFLITVGSRELPFPDSANLYKTTPWNMIRGGRRIIDNDPAQIEPALKELATVCSSDIICSFKILIIEMLSECSTIQMYNFF